MSGKTSNESKTKYNAKAYDRIELTVPKGDKERIQAHAKTLGLSVNAFIAKAVETSMKGQDQ